MSKKLVKVNSQPREQPWKDNERDPLNLLESKTGLDRRELVRFGEIKILLKNCSKRLNDCPQARSMLEIYRECV